MALSDNKIGPYPFISLRGEPIPPRQTLQIDDRPGVDGSEVVLTGVKGQPFTLVSMMDAVSFDQGSTFINDYQGLIEQAPVALVRGGVSSDGLGYRVKVLDVRPARIMAMAGAVGNAFNPPSLAMVECQWDLLAIPFEEE